MVKKRKRKSGLVGKIALGAAVLGTLIGCGNKNNEMVYHENLGAYAPKNYQVENATEANKFLINLSQEVNGIKRLDKYLSKGAKNVWIHVRNMHGGENMSKKDSIDVRNCQKDVYGFLDYMIKNHSLKAVYSEAIFSDSINYDAIDLALEFLPNHLDKRPKMFLDNQINKYNFSKGTLSFGENLFGLGSVKENIWDLYKVTVNNLNEFDAVRQLVYEGRLQVLPTEDKNVHKIASDLILSEGYSRSDEYVRKVLDAREDVVINKNSRGTKSGLYDIVVFGGNHCWAGENSFQGTYDLDGRTPSEDNLKKCSVNYSLIEAVPKSYPSLYKFRSSKK